MSTATKLAYLNETKTKIREGLNTLGADLDTEDTFRSYADAIENIYDKYPKITGDGESLSLDNTGNAPMKIDYKGNTSQITYTGKNLLPFPFYATSKTENGVTWTVNNDGSITVNGTATGGYSIFNLYYSSNVNLINDTSNQYTFYTGLPSTSSNILRISGEYINGSMNYYANSSSQIGTVFTVSSSASGQLFRLSVATGTTVNNVRVYPMIVKGNYSGDTTSYEPYVGGIPSPNPNYPQDIHVVSGDNEIVVSNKNLFTYGTKSDYTGTGTTHFVVGNDTLYNLIANGAANHLIKKDKFYGNKFNVNASFDKSTSRLLVKAFNNNDEEITSSVSGWTYNSFYGAYYIDEDSANFTTSNLAYIRFGVVWKGTSGEYGTYSNLMVTTSSDTTYEPYIGTTYPIYLGVENLLDSTNGTTQTISGVTFTKNSDGTITANGTATAGITYMINNYTWTTLQAGTYILSDGVDGENNNTYFTYLDVENADSLYLSTIATNTRTYTTSVRFRTRIVIRNGITLNNVIFKPQLEKGTKANSFSPYGTTPIELGGIGNYVDFLFKAINGDKYYDSLTQAQKDLLTYGSWYVHKEIGRFYSNSTTGWFSDGNNRYYRSIDNIVVPPNNDTVGQGFCNVRLVTANQTLITSTTPGLAIHPISRLYISEVVYNNIPTTPIVLYYAYITPTNTEITDTTLISQLEENKLSYESQTNISQENNDLPFILDVKALRGE